ncbi:MAG: OmpA family protein [Pseudomonadales bacterium]|nr:OmpA family protein [Pseudomonadales bacterium]
MIKSLISLTAVALTLTACTTFDAYTGESKMSSTAKGAAIGASVAAVAAYIGNKDASSDKRRDRILKSAAGGAAIGGGIGYYMDHQEAKLRKQLRGTGVSVEREGDNINLIMPGDITFENNSSGISGAFFPVLDSVALVLKEYDKTIVAVAGHTDSVGSNSSNKALSQKRASSVAGYLKSKKILSERFEIIAFGETQPIADNGTATGRDANRRVEITLLPVQEG